MEIFEQIKDMAKSASEKTEAIAKTVGEKAEATMEIQKLNAAIEKAEARIREHYAKIGEEMYKHYVEVGKTPEHLVDNFAVVAASMAEVNDMKNKIAEIKMGKGGCDIPKTTCPACQKEIIANAKFCHECGAPVAKKPSVMEEVKEEIAETKKIYAEAHAEALAVEEYPR